MNPDEKNDADAMALFTGYLLGKVELDEPICSEILTSLVETLLQRQQSDSDDKLLKFSNENKYSITCSEQGLKLTSTSTLKARDEGFESDSDSTPSQVPDTSDSMTQENVTDLAQIMELFDVSTFYEEIENGQPITATDPTDDLETTLTSELLPPPPTTDSLDTSSISSKSSNSGLNGDLDDRTSSSGNGSDSDECCPSLETNTSTITRTKRISVNHDHVPLSYRVQDVLLCHSEPQHPHILVWVVSHFNSCKLTMTLTALVTAFSRSTEAQSLMKIYDGLRVISPEEAVIVLAETKKRPIFQDLPPKSNIYFSTDSAPSSVSSSTNTIEIETEFEFSADKLDTVSSASLNCGLKQPNFNSSLYKTLPTKSVYYNSNLMGGTLRWREGGRATSSDAEREEEPLQLEGGAESDQECIKNQPAKFKIGATGIPVRRIRTNDREGANFENKGANSNSSGMPKLKGCLVNVTAANTLANAITSENPAGNLRLKKPAPRPPVPPRKPASKPLVVVPLKSDIGPSKPQIQYPKEAYMYPVLSRTSSTFAPYQRSMNFLPPNPSQFLVPFSSELPQQLPSRGRPQLRSGTVRIRSTSRSSLSDLKCPKNGTTSKILLKDLSGYPHGVWANLSQRVKRNVRENLMPKLNWMFSPPTTTATPTGENPPKRKSNKEVTFNAWATVQRI